MPEKRTSHFRIVTYDFDASWGFRGAIDKYYKIFPEYFRNDSPEQGLWMPFRTMTEFKGHEDFGITFKEGTNDTAWEDKHGILTFGYLMLGKWWMDMNVPKPWTYPKAFAELSRRQENNPSDEWLSAVETSVVHDTHGRKFMTYSEELWCKGVGWSMNSMPGVKGEYTDYKLRRQEAKELLASEELGKGNVDGLFIDSLGGFMTTRLNDRLVRGSLRRPGSGLSSPTARFPKCDFDQP